MPAIDIVMNALIRDFGAHISMNGLEVKARRDRFMTRALAALIVRDRTSCSAQTAAASVTDGAQDLGIDAIGLSADGSQVWLVQTKWSEAGNARIGEYDVEKIIDGLVKIENGSRLDTLNPQIARFAGQVRGALRSGGMARIVLAYLGSHALGPEVAGRIEHARKHTNRYDNRLEFEVVDLDEVMAMVARASTRAPIRLTVELRRWFKLDDPMVAFNGVVAAADVARWYADHGNLLFASNVRESLGFTHVNAAIAESLAAEPDAFWYRNNGITMLCDQLGMRSMRVTEQDADGMVLDANGVSIVNGAQTVTAIARAVAATPAAGAGLVGVRIIQSADPAAGRRITEATNTQNAIERRDYAAIDPVQIALQEEFASLGLAYSIRRGELEPSARVGCSVREAALALACAHPTTDLVYRAGQNLDLLWERGDEGAYTLLFSERPSALQVWRCVQLLRAVRDAIAVEEASLSGRAAAIVEYGDLLIAHLVFRLIGGDVEDPDFDWNQKVLAQVESQVKQTIAWLVSQVDRRAADGKAALVSANFASPAQVRDLVLSIIDSVERKATVPTLSGDYRQAPTARRKRRKTPVPILVDAGRLKDGAQLTYRPASNEGAAVRKWLAADERRGRATWINDRSQPLVWEVDGKRRSPSALVKRIWELAEWGKAPSAAHGEIRWVVSELGLSLKELADATGRQEGMPADEDGEEPQATD